MISSTSKSDLDKYYAQNLGEVWSNPSYKNYENVNWDWGFLPFSEDFNRREFKNPKILNLIEGKKILEVGSAMGCAYKFMKNSKMLDLSDYTGIEVSTMGHETSKKRFPETNWVNADFTKFTIDKKYDYVFERHAVHHMPNPLEQYRKLLEATNVSFSTVFRGCIHGNTISDLSKSFFRTEDDGKYFSNIINLFEFVNLSLDMGFNHIKILYDGLHEPISSNIESKMYLDPEISAEDRLISRFRVRVSRLPNNSKPMLYAYAYPGILIKTLPIIYRINRMLKKSK